MHHFLRVAQGILASGARAAGLSGAGEARASGRYPTAMQLAPRPGHPEHIALRATFGVLFSRDGGQTWDWVCENGMGYGPRSDYLLALTEKGTAMMAALEGLAISHDDGCNWAFAGGPLHRREVLDVTVYSGEPSFALAITPTGAISVSHDEGVTWEAYGAVDPATRPITIDVAPSDPLRVYVSALRSDGTSLNGAFFVSRDGGATFSEHAVALLPEEAAAYIAAVDPKNADRVYLRTSGDESGALPSRLLVSDNGGASFTVRYTGEQMLGFALAEEGARVYLGGVQNGLLSASTSDFVFAPRAKVPLQCLAADGNGLWACSNETNDGFFLGLSGDDGASFVARLRKRPVRGPLACPETSTTARCLAEWPETQYILGMVDGGPVDAGAIIALDGGKAIGGGNDGRQSDDGCGTSPLSPANVGEPRAVRALASVAAVVALAFGWRAYRRRRDR